ncbi:MAG: alpha/beta hydrolase [Clostridia bacterium]|nr:alpha/beta hydrolase [Blautia sp.]MBR3430720.1 alpha/beta hydrolase [Clostridia bacterium]
MKKFVKALLIVVLVIVVLVIVVIAALGRMAKDKNEKYYEYTSPVGVIEKKYTPMGSSEVTSIEFKSDNAQIGRFVIHYPTELEKETRKFPVVLWANGTGSKSDTYTSFLTHLSSWGFIVVSNDDENTRTGESLNAGIDLLIKENDNPNIVLYQKIDLDNLGIGGHSQGGPAVFNMATVQLHADMIKTVYAVSATSSYHTKVYKDGWEYDISKVNVPTLLTAGTQAFDAGTATSAGQESDEKAGILQGICPLWSLEENFGLLPDIDKVYVRKTNVDHGDSHLQFDAYMTAWFRFYLMSDEDAGTAFFGESPELSTNDHYQDFKAYKSE